ncbi:flagellin [Neptunomonas sp.]|uniref:flagellin N-terminal helical domain-containing protein n=1 Tax=Neptunomonas sp. TaxID=1971898 RepID=UPI0035674652
MSMVINSNIMSLNAQRNLTLSQNDQNTSMERLTSGLRINSAADDAAGLSISSRMTSQINGLGQAVRNANDGASMIQTAEGALDESTNILQRMRELAIQSASGTYDSGNRSTLNAEVSQLVAELDRISETTSFNGLNILDGSLGSVELQVGSEANQTIELNIGKMDSKSLGGSSSGQLLGSNVDRVADITLAAGDVKINGQDLAAWDTTGTDELQDLLDNINNGIDGVTASTFAEVVATNKGDGILATGEQLALSVTFNDGTSQTYQVKDTGSLDELADKITSTTGGVITASVNDEGKLVMASESAGQIQVTTDVTGATGTLAASTETQLVLNAEDGKAIRVEGNNADLVDLGFNERSASGEIEGTAANTTKFSAGDLTINGIAIGESENGSIAKKIAAINAVSSQTDVTATEYATLEVAAATITGGTAAAVTINGVASGTPAGDTVDDFVTAINSQTDAHGVTAINQGGDLVLESDSTFTITDTTGPLTEATTVADRIKLTSGDGSEISIDLSDTDLAGAKARTGFLETNVTDSGAFGGSIAKLDISTAAGAQSAIGTIDAALEQINSTRGDLGAVSNRLDFTVNNLSNISENVSAARSTIMDADFAAESANLSRAQVLQQAGTAMLAQANAAPQQVLSLLQ